jgi:hypothetical protein
MPEVNEPDSDTPRWLRRIDSKLDLLADIARETRTRVGLLEQQCASMPSRSETVENRLERIERRLDLVEAPA